VFNNLPLWARGTTRVAFACLTIAVVFFGLMGLLLIVFPQWAVHQDGLLYALLVAGGTAFSGFMVSIGVLAFKASEHSAP
jgi:hypothetical protein